MWLRFWWSVYSEVPHVKPVFLVLQTKWTVSTGLISSQKLGSIQSMAGSNWFRINGNHTATRCLIGHTLGRKLSHVVFNRKLIVNNMRSFMSFLDYRLNFTSVNLSWPDGAGRIFNRQNSRLKIFKPSFGTLVLKLHLFPYTEHTWLHVKDAYADSEYGGPPFYKFNEKRAPNIN